MRSLSLIWLVLLLVACAGSPPPPPGQTSRGPNSPAASGLPAPSFDVSAACSGALPGQATRYPGWPPGQTFELLPVPVSSELSVGSNRVLLNLLDDKNQPLASPEREVELRFYDLAADPGEPAITIEADYLETTESLPGLYRAAPVKFPCWGEWGLEAVATEPDGSQRSGRMVFSVRPTSSTPPIGAQAPRSDTPTGSTSAEIGAISTDSQPDPDFYGTSVSQALDEGRPFLLIFSTPAFCRTRTCGPALDIVKSVAPEFKDDVAFIHVEPYQLEIANGRAQPVLGEQNQPLVVESVLEWGLPAEPYIFVVDEDGRVTAKLEGVASAEELEDALRQVAQ